MCALIINPIWGELSGKLGGQVFARNGHGSYVRQYTKPMNPNTVAQQDARGTFTASVNLYSSLSAVERTAWNDYAKNWFKPRNLSRTGKNNGYDAFMSLNQVRRMMVLNLRAYTTLFDGVSKFGELDTCFFYVDKPTPPEKSKSIIYDNGVGTKYSLKLGDLEMSYKGELDFTLVNNDVGQNIYTKQNIDVNGNRNGYVIYCSEPKRFEGGFYKTPLSKAIAYIAPWRPSSTPVSPISYVEEQYSLAEDYKRYKFKSYPQVNDWVLITIYSVDCEGQLEQFDSREIQVKSSI